MKPPFTADQFFEVFVRYNDAVWPAPYVLNAPGVLAFLLAISPWRHAGRVVALQAGLLWWVGVVRNRLRFGEGPGAGRIIASVWCVFRSPYRSQFPDEPAHESRPQLGESMSAKTKSLPRKP